MPIKTLADPAIAYSLATEKDWAEAYVTVFAPGTLFVSSNKEHLEQSEGGSQQGAQYTAQNTTGNAAPQRIRFIGTLYGRGSVRAMQVDVTVFAERRDGNTSQSGATVSRPRCR
jgi:hypothetical protein